MIKAAEATSNPLALLLYGVEAHRLYMEESKLFYDAILLRTEDSVQSLGHILQRMYLSRDAMTLVRSYIGESILLFVIPL